MQSDLVTKAVQHLADNGDIKYYTLHWNKSIVVSEQGSTNRWIIAGYFGILALVVGNVFYDSRCRNVKDRTSKKSNIYPYRANKETQTVSPTMHDAQVSTVAYTGHHEESDFESLESSEE